MIKLWLCIFLISIAISSCVLVQDFFVATEPYWETDKEDGVLGYHYKVYVENKVDEKITIFYYDGRRLGSVRKGKIKVFNVEKNNSIYIIGKNSQNQYLSAIRVWDQMTIVIQNKHDQ